MEPHNSGSWRASRSSRRRTSCSAPCSWRACRRGATWSSRSPWSSTPTASCTSRRATAPFGPRRTGRRGAPPRRTWSAPCVPRRPSGASGATWRRAVSSSSAAQWPWAGRRTSRPPWTGSTHGTRKGVKPLGVHRPFEDRHGLGDVDYGDYAKQRPHIPSDAGIEDVD